MCSLGIFLARPNLGQPAIIAPRQLASGFRITVAGGEWSGPQAPSAAQVLQQLQSLGFRLRFRSKLGHTVDIGSAVLTPLASAPRLAAVPAGLYAAQVRPNDKSGLTDGYHEDAAFPVTSDEHRWRLGVRWELDFQVSLSTENQSRLLAQLQLPCRIDLRLGSDSNHHALFVTDRALDAPDWVVWQATDPHVARRNDRMLEVLLETRTLSERLDLQQRYVNFNQNLRVLIAQANEAYARRELDLIVITGDLVDHHVDRVHAREADAMNNYALLRDILTARDGRGPALECPVFTLLGNHDYRPDEPPLLLNAYLSQVKTALLAAGAVQASGIDVLISVLTGGLVPPGATTAITASAAGVLVGIHGAMERTDHGTFGLNRAEGGEYEEWVNGRDRAQRLAYKKAHADGSVPLPQVEAPRAYQYLMPRYAHLAFYLREFSYDLDFIVRAGPHRLVCMNTGYDRLPAPSTLIASKVWSDSARAEQPAWVRDAVDGHVHSRGFTAEHLRLLRQAREEAGDAGLVALFCHAPLLTPGHNLTDGFEQLFSARHAGQGELPNEATWALRRMDGEHDPHPAALRQRLGRFDDNERVAWQQLEEAARQYRVAGFPQRGDMHFYTGPLTGAEATDLPLMNFGAADFCESAGAARGTLRRDFIATLCATDTAAPQRNPVLGVFAGHTHLAHEIALAASAPSGAQPLRITLRADDFSGSGGMAFNAMLQGAHLLPGVVVPRPRALKPGPEVLSMTAGGLKTPLVHYRRLAFGAGAVADASLHATLPKGGATRGFEFLHARIATWLALQFSRQSAASAQDRDPFVHLAYARRTGRDAVVMNICQRLVSLLDARFAPTRREPVADLYAELALRLNALGSVTGNGPRDSMDRALHLSWALNPATRLEDLETEVVLRVEALADFAQPKAGGHHLLCCWFTEESVELARLGGYQHPVRDSVVPALHRNWAAGQNAFVVIPDLIEKHRMQFERQKPKHGADAAACVEYCAAALVRAASWGAEASAEARPSTDVANWRATVQSLVGRAGYDAVWAELKHHLERVGAALVAAEIGTG